MHNEILYIRRHIKTIFRIRTILSVILFTVIDPSLIHAQLLYNQVTIIAINMPRHMIKSNRPLTQALNGRPRRGSKNSCRIPKKVLIFGYAGGIPTVLR